jgi:branched-chain amino acid transport system substrate-binding protein
MLRRNLALAAVAAAAFAVPTLFTPGLAQAQIRIASAGPMTGQYASFGLQLRNGAEMAVADINARGGVLGQQLVLEIGDDACDPRQATSVANQLASRRVQFVAGHFCSSSSIPASKVYAEEGVLQMTPASTNPRFTDEGGWNTFRTCGRDDQQGVVAGSFLARSYAGQRVAILHDNTTYGKGIADETKKAMNAGGLQEAMYQAYVPGERDYSALVSRMKQANINAVYFGGYHTEAGLIIRQMREQGLNAVAIGADSLVTAEFWQISGPAGEGTLMTFPSDPRQRATARDVVARFKAKNIDPEGYTLYTYAAIEIWAQAATKAGTTDPRRVAAMLKSGGPWNSVLGPISFDAKGDVTAADYVFYVWRNGNYQQM